MNERAMPGEESGPVARYIAVDGPIGAGKTTLAHALGRALDADLLLEAPQENPFLGDFYADMRTHALASQLCFLLQRIRQLSGQDQRTSQQRPVVADFLFEKDRLFASLTLSEDELDLYEEIAGRLAGPVFPVPDRVVYLRAPPDILMRRIRRRGRPEERELEPGYLRRLCEAYAAFFASHALAPVITIDTAALDPAGDEGTFRRVLEALKNGETQVLPG